jgi:hypothetical protein
MGAQQQGVVAAATAARLSSGCSKVAEPAAAAAVVGFISIWLSLSLCFCLCVAATHLSFLSLCLPSFL